MREIIRIKTPSYTRRPRRRPPSMIMIHATRGHTTLDLQDEATINWFKRSPRRGSPPYWGSTADALVSSDGELFEFGDIFATHSTWSAGYGALGPSREYGADEHCIALELAQPAYNVGEQPPMFAPTTLEAAAWLCRQWVDQFGIPIDRIRSWSQRRGPIPRGFLGHEDCANGLKLGKHDPGPAFPWDEFLEMVKYQPQPLGRVEAMREAAYATMRMFGRYFEEPALTRQGTRVRHGLVIPRRRRT